MGNVAHDLKTPLHSIKADLEVLCLLMSKIPKAAIAEAVALLQASSLYQNFDPESIFNTMDATCKFMMMSINRSQDFMKASNNIALLPVQSTFDIGNAVSMSVICIKRIESDRLVVVHPFDDRMCSHMVSDEHWLMENMLCLLSNAMKYSEKGDVDVLISIMDDHTDENDRSAPSSMLNSRHSSLRIPRKKDSFFSCSSLKKYSSLQIPVKAKKDEPMVLITVEDHGIGISKKARKDLFQPFKQAQRMAGGTGLGLYSLLKRVEALDGEV
jgi:signal transduction histidine kinase